jgi:Arc/MetJ-type ribon-helix-helix transcriptional regulator
MSIVLSPDVEQQIQELVTSGRFPSADACVRTCVAWFRQHEQDQRKWLAKRQAHGHEVRRLVAAGTAALERGDYVDYDDESLKAFIEQIKREVRERRKLPNAS